MSSLDERLNSAIDALNGPGVVEVKAGSARAKVVICAAGPIGLSVKGLSVSGLAPQPINTRAEGWADRVEGLGTSLQPVEVCSQLNGALLRSRLDRAGGFFELEVRGDEAEVRRYGVVAGERERIRWQMTREKLGETIDELLNDAPSSDAG